MALTDPSSTITTGMQSSTTSYTAGEEPWNKNKDGFVIDSEGTEIGTYQCDWDKWHGMYRNIPELRSTIDIWCKWIIGNKLNFENKAQEKQSKRINGNGKDTLRKILINVKRTSKAGGDGFAEIIEDKAGRLINLKILDPGTIEIQSDNLGIIQKYVQVSIKSENGRMPDKSKRKILHEWEPKQIFHITNDRIADEIHGIPEPEKLQTIIKWRHQSMEDLSVVFHRYVKPLLQIMADTDDETELATLKDKFDQAVKNMENIIIPKGVVSSTERISIPQYSTLDPLPWLIFLRSYFTESSGVPDLVRGKSDEVSLAAGKLNYLAFKEKIINEQKEYEEEIESQLGLKITFEPPKEIDIEISRTEEDMSNKTQAKKEKGGDQIVNSNIRTSEKS